MYALGLWFNFFLFSNFDFSLNYLRLFRRLITFIQMQWMCHEYKIYVQEVGMICSYSWMHWYWKMAIGEAKCALVVSCPRQQFCISFFFVFFSFCKIENKNILGMVIDNNIRNSEQRVLILWNEKWTLHYGMRIRWNGLKINFE